MLASVAILASCSDQLDTLPDNRTTLDTPKKIAGLLVTAYPIGQSKMQVSLQMQASSCPYI